MGSVAGGRVVGASVVCVFESRPSERVAVKLLIASLAKHCPDLEISLTFPPADDHFSSWLTRYPQVALRVEPLRGAYGWNVKPHAILPLLAAGAREVWWMDSDVIVTKDFRSRSAGISDTALVACEEGLYGRSNDNGICTRAWGFEIGNARPLTLNSCITRTTAAHVPLLERWKELLESEKYVELQQGPWYERPFHMMSDQDVLTALVSSREFAAVPLIYLRRGEDIIQYWGPPGYTVRERLLNMRTGLPPFVHEEGPGKPWHIGRMLNADGLRPSVDRLYSELSPYRHCAKAYRVEIEDELKDMDWLEYASPTGTVLKYLGLGSAPLTGLPLALGQTMWSRAKTTGRSLHRTARTLAR